MSERRNERKSNSQGFTLIEIVVVIAIVAILGGLLFPGLSTAEADADIETDRAASNSSAGKAPGDLVKAHWERFEAASKQAEAHLKQRGRLPPRPDASEIAIDPDMKQKSLSELYEEFTTAERPRTRMIFAEMKVRHEEAVPNLQRIAREGSESSRTAAEAALKTIQEKMQESTKGVTF